MTDQTDTSAGAVEQYEVEHWSNECESGACMIEADDGDWVKYDDYAALLAAKEKAEAERDQLRLAGRIFRRKKHMADSNAARAEARAEAAEAERDESRRRRDEWRKKAEGYDEVRRALREKVGEPWPPNMSRLLWAGIAADERKRADDAEAEAAALREGLEGEVLNAALAEFNLRHSMETVEERIGRQSAVRGIMVRLGLYDRFEEALDQPKEGEDNEG